MSDINTTYENLNRSWKSMCRLLLGEEIGEMKEYEKWLTQYLEPMRAERSAISCKDVYVAVQDYCKGAKFISLEDTQAAKPAPLSINEIKDIDSIIDAFHERFLYSGNIILSNSRDVSQSTNIQNSFHILRSNFIWDSEYVGFSSMVRGGKHLLGVNNDAYSSFMLSSMETYKNSRCLELWESFDCTGSYFTFGSWNCQNILFSFNQRNKRNAIGNIELPRDKFLSLKDKLIEEMRDELKRNKSLPSLFEIASANPRKPKIPAGFSTEEMQEGTDKGTIEDAFRNTTKIVLGKELQGMDAYGDWLLRHVIKTKPAASAATGRPTSLSSHAPYKFYPRDRIVKVNESIKLGEILHMDESDINSLDSLKDSLWKIAFFCSEIMLGENKNLIGVMLANQSSNCYKGSVYSYDEYCGFSFWPRDSKYMFGSSMAFSCNFCMDAYNSVNLSRCFETESCSNSSDLYFSHNCENAQDAMFCFNSKNLKHAIGNTLLEPCKYKSTKSALLSQVAGELERTKTLKWDIYNIGCAMVKQ
ncbi:MAG: hypothetical protein PHQ80_01635 [Candidatus ainarchaeum sp.]|nr:hypothetical protein [Candidatus ainarchaeum sp.]